MLMQRCNSILRIQQNFLICFLLFATSSFVEKCTRIGSEHDMNNFVQIFVFLHWKSNAHFIQFGSNHYIFVYHVLKRSALTSFMKEKNLSGKSKWFPIDNYIIFPDICRTPRIYYEKRQFTSSFNSDTTTISRTPSSNFLIACRLQTSEYLSLHMVIYIILSIDLRFSIKIKEKYF